MMSRRINNVKKRVTYTDYNNIERTEDLYFNLTKAEILEMEMSTSGGLAEQITKVIETQDHPTIIKIFKDLVLKSYGEESPDGRRFMKNDEIRTAFSETEAYSMVFMELATDAKAAVAFVNGIIPDQPQSTNNLNTPVGSMLEKEIVGNR